MLTKSDQKTLYRLFKNAADQSAIKLSEITRKPWQAGAPAISSNPEEHLSSAFSNQDESYSGTCFSIPGGAVLMVLPKKSVQKVVGTFLADQQGWIKSIPNLEQSVSSEISNVIVNKFIGVLADSCEMGFVVASPEALLGGKKELCRDIIRKISHNNDAFAVAGFVEMRCAELSADCTMMIFLNSAMASRMLQSLRVIYLTAFLDGLVSEISWFLIPLLALTFGANGTQVGWLNACPLLVSLLISFWIGHFSDRFGRRPILILSAGIKALAMFGIGFARNLPTVFAGCTLAGVGSQSSTTQSAYIADVTLKDERLQKITPFGTAIWLASVIGPIIGGWLAKMGLSLAFYLSACIGALNLFLLYAKLPESMSAKRKPEAPSFFDSKAIRKLLSSRNIRLLIATSAFLSLGYCYMYQTLILYISRQLFYSAQEIGYLLAFMGLLSAGVEFLVVNKLARRFGETGVLCAGILLLTTGTAIIPISFNTPSLLASLGLIALGSPLIAACLETLFSFDSSPETQGATQGLNSACASTAGIVGLLTAGLVYDRISPTMPFSFGAIFFQAGLLCALGLKFWSESSPEQLG